jgi:hypothetical protein
MFLFFTGAASAFAKPVRNNNNDTLALHHPKNPEAAKILFDEAKLPKNSPIQWHHGCSQNGAKALPERWR